MPTEAPETDARGHHLHCPLGLLGDADLAAVSGRAEPRDRVHRQAHVPGVGQGRPAAVDTGADANVDPVRPCVLAEHPLDRERRVERVGRSLEAGEVLVGVRIDLVTTGGSDGTARTFRVSLSTDG